MAHTKNMDAQSTLGKIIKDDDAKRDAVHIAVMPCVAGCLMGRGQEIFVIGDGSAWPANCRNNAIGIADPYIERPIKRGERFWVFLLPNTISGLRHAWTHPSIPDESTQIDATDEWEASNCPC